MIVAIELHGSITHGLWSPERGESRWAQNLAAILAEAGNEVIGFGPMTGDGWGTCPRIPNVTLVDWSVERDIRCDVFFDSAHWAGKPIRPQARHVLLGYFGHAPIDLGSRAPNWHLVYPYRHCPHEDGSQYLPYVMLGTDFWGKYTSFYENRIPVRDGILWGNKDPYGVGADPGRKNGVLYANELLSTLENLKSLCYSGAEHKIYFLGVHRMDASWSQAAGASNARERAEGIGAGYGELPYGQVLQLMHTSKICVNLPIWGSLPLEAALNGCCPLAWEGVPILTDAVRHLDLVIPVETFDPPRLRDVLKRLILDGWLRSQALEAYQDALKDYSVPFTLECWNNIVNKL